MKSIIEYKSFNCDLKDVDKTGRVMVGAFTAYNNKDSDGDIGKKGMFTKTWSENFGRIKHLLNHDVTKPVGKVEKLWEDDFHAYYKSKVGTHKLGDDVLEMALSGLLTEHSYGYQRIKENKTKDGNELLEVKQWEFSNLTGWGANSKTPLISFQKDAIGAEEFSTKLMQRQSALETFCRNTTASDETIELLLLESKHLSQIILDFNNTTEPEESKGNTDDSQDSTLPEEIAGALTNFFQQLN